MVKRTGITLAITFIAVVFLLLLRSIEGSYNDVLTVFGSSISDSSLVIYDSPSPWTYDGAIIAEDSVIQVGRYTNPSVGRTGLLFKTSIQGSIIEQKQFYLPGITEVQFTNVSSTSDGGYIVGGFRRIANAPMFAIALKFDANDSLEWAREYGLSHEGESYSLYIESIKEVPNGFLFVGGFRNSNLATLDTRGLIVKLDDSGTVDWQMVYSGRPLVYTDFEETDDGFIVVGVFADGVNQVVILKITPDGEEVGKTGFGEPTGSANQSLDGVRIAKASDNEFYVMHEYRDYGDTFHPNSIWLVKIDSDGNVIDSFSKVYKDPNNTEFFYATEIVPRIDGGATIFYNDGVGSGIITIGPDGAIIAGLTKRLNRELPDGSTREPYVYGADSTVEGIPLAFGTSWIYSGSASAEGHFYAYFGNDNLAGCDHCNELTLEAIDVSTGTPSTDILIIEAFSSIEDVSIEQDLETDNTDVNVLHILCKYVSTIVQKSDLIETNGQFFPNGKAVFAVTIMNNGTENTPPIHPFVFGTDPNLKEWQTEGTEYNIKILSPEEEHTYYIPFFFDDGDPLGTWETTSIDLWTFDSNSDTYYFYGDFSPNGFQQAISFEVTNAPEPFLDLPVRYDYWYNEVNWDTYNGGNPLNALLGLKLENGIPGPGMVTSWYDHFHPTYCDPPNGNGVYIGNGDCGEANDRVYVWDGSDKVDGAAQCVFGWNCYDGHDGTDFQRMANLSNIAAGFGVDLDNDGNTNDPIHAAAAGTLRAICKDGEPRAGECALYESFGNYLLIQHDSNDPCIATVYAHLDGIDPSLELGDSIENQQLIGEMGSSGNQAAVHLHFGVYWDCLYNWTNDTSIDPYGWNGTGTDIAGITNPVAMYLWKYEIPNGVAVGNGGLSLEFAPIYMDIPPGALPEGTEVTLLRTTAYQSPSTDLSSIGISFKIEIETVQPPSTTLQAKVNEEELNVPATLTVVYNEQQLLKVLEEEIAIYRWDEQLTSWIKLPTTVDLVNNVLEAETTTGGYFDVQGIAKQEPIFIPIVFK